MGRFLVVGLRAFLTTRSARRMMRRHYDWLFDIALVGTVMTAVFAYALYIGA